MTDEQVQRTGVLLDVAVYQQLVGQNADDSDLLTGMSREELEALAASRLAQADQLTLLKTHARYTLAQIDTAQ